MKSTELKHSTVLVVDDNPTNLGLLFEYLNAYSITVLVAEDGESAFALIKDRKPDLILLDIWMPGMNGFEVCTELKRQEYSRDIPIIFISAMSDTTGKLRGFDLGAVDFITKPFHKEEVLARITAQLTILNQRRALEKEIEIRKNSEEELRKSQDVLEEKVKERTVELSGANEQLRNQIEQYKKARQSIEYRLSFDEVVTRISSNLISASAENIFDQLHISLEQLAAFLDVERAYVLFISESLNKIEEAIEYYPPDQNPGVSLFKGMSIDAFSIKFPFFKHLIGDDQQILKVDDLDQLPEAAEIEKAMFASLNVKSFLMIPLIEDGKVEGFIGFNAKKTKRIWSEVDISMLKIVGEIFHNSYKRKIYEERITQYSEELQQTNASKDKFFSIIAHDLMNPFTVMMTLSDMLVRYYDRYEDEKRIKNIIDINQAVKRTYSFLENLLQWARSQKGTIEVIKESLSLMELLTQVHFLHKTQLEEKQITLNFDIPENTTIFADKNTITTVFRNLIANAIKFTHQGGEITITVKQDDQHTDISITDNGIGMKQEHLEKLFKIDQSSTTVGTANEKGTGLGLILCKEFIDKNGGELRVNSQEGKGSCFTVTLPTKQEE